MSIYGEGATNRIRRLELTPKIVGSIVVTLLVTWAGGFYITKQRSAAQWEGAFADTDIFFPEL